MEPSDEELTRIALNQYANWIETEDPLLSRNDAIRQKKLSIIKPLADYQLERVQRIRDLERKYR